MFIEFKKERSAEKGLRGRDKNGKCKIVEGGRKRREKNKIRETIRNVCESGGVARWEERKIGKKLGGKVKRD